MSSILSIKLQAFFPRHCPQQWPKTQTYFCDVQSRNKDCNICSRCNRQIRHSTGEEKRGESTTFVPLLRPLTSGSSLSFISSQASILDHVPWLPCALNTCANTTELSTCALWSQTEELRPQKTDSRSARQEILRILLCRKEMGCVTLQTLQCDFLLNIFALT